MKGIRRFLAVLAAAVLLLSVISCEAEDEAGEDSFLLKIWDRSGLEISYLRFDLYAGEEYRGLVCSCPNEGEDFYRAPCSVGDAEELKNLRLTVSYGVSDLAPEDAILQVMMGNPQEEHELLTLDFIPEYGKTYELELVSDGAGGWLLVPAEAA